MPRVLPSTERPQPMPPPPPPPPELSDDVLGEAFLRLPPDDPACLLRASLTCKRWRRVLADPAFRRRHRELHRTPSVVGFFHRVEGDAPYASRFLVPFDPASGRPAARDLPGWLVLDCRHGRALFCTPSPSLGTELNYDLVVWDPLTNEQRCLPRPSPPPTYSFFNAAVLCAAAAEGCEHSKCHGGPFRVALVWNHSRADPPSILVSARVYSSETGNWSEPISVQDHNGFIDMLPCASKLVGDTLYFRYDSHALEYQLGVQRLSIIDGPPDLPSCAVSLMSMEDGGLGFMDMGDDVDLEEDVASPQLQLWSKEAASDSDGVARWTRGKVIDIEKLLPDGALPSPSWSSDDSDPLTGCRRIRFLGSAEGTDVIFVGTWERNQDTAVYMVQLNSGRARKMFDKITFVVPYTSFCIPVTDTSSATEGAGDDAACA